MGKGGGKYGGKGGRGKGWASPGWGSFDPANKVHVTNMVDAVQWQELKDHMRAAGTVEFCNVKNGVGEVRYSSAQEAQASIELLNGSELMGSLIAVSAFI